MNMYVHAKRFALVWYAIPRLCKCSHSIVKARSFSSLRMAGYSVVVEKRAWIQLLLEGRSYFCEVGSILQTHYQVLQENKQTNKPHLMLTSMNVFETICQ